VPLNEITVTVVPCGGVVTIDLVSVDPGTWTLTRFDGITTYTLYQGPPLVLPVNAPFFLDSGEGLNGPLVPSVSYTYTFSTATAGAVSQTVVPACSIVLEYDDYLRLLINVIQAGVQSIVVPNGPQFKAKPSVVISMPLVGQPTMPAISINEDLLQMEEVPLGHGINTDTVNNFYQIQEIVNRRYRVTVMTFSVEERDFWKLAVISIFKAILIPVLIKMGQDVRSSFQAASSQSIDTMPGFYFCDIMLDFSGILPVRITTSYPIVEGFTVTVNGELTITFGVLYDDGGVLVLPSGTVYPTSPAGLPPGAVFTDDSLVNVVSGITPDPLAPPVYLSDISPAGLLVLGGGNLPLIDPLNAGQLWNNGGLVCVSVP
jgi:hypothetical protein